MIKRVGASQRTERKNYLLRQRQWYKKKVGYWPLILESDKGIIIIRKEIVERISTKISFSLDDGDYYEYRYRIMDCGDHFKKIGIYHWLTGYRS